MLNELNFLKNFDQYNNIFILAVQLIIAAISYYYNANYKTLLEKEIEKFKHKLHVEYLKAEVKTKQLFTVYPTLFAHLKEVEAEIFWLMSCNTRTKVPPIKEKVPFPGSPEEIESDKTNPTIPTHCLNASCDIQKVKETFIKANNYCMYKLVFLSEGVAKVSLELCDLMKNCLYCDNEIQIKTWEDIKKRLDRLENLIRKELSNSEKKIEPL